MYILVFNCGSSSVRYQLIETETRNAKCRGLLERIGLPESKLTYNIDGVKHVVSRDVDNHDAAVRLILDSLTDTENGVISDLSEIKAVGHRVVHGGEKYSSAVLIDDEVAKNIEDCFSLAPLHNPANLMGITACGKFLGSAPQVAVFDTAFHQTMPEHAYLYAIPMEYYNRYKIRRYGFHGTSHRFVSRRAAEVFGTDINSLKIITCHLGNGASVAAVKNGKVCDTSMGFTPLAGLIMGTRSGDIDPSIITALMKRENLSPDDLDEVLNKKSGVLGITGVSSDMRDIENAAWNSKDKNAQLALDMYHYRIVQYIGAYAASMNGVDIVVFTGGVGENGWETREEIIKNLTYLGITADPEKNRCRGKEAVITTPDSKVTVMVIPTNEELEIADECMKIVQQ